MKSNNDGLGPSGPDDPGRKPQYYDRNPSKKSESHTASPGASTRSITTDWSYTVPTDKKAFVELLGAFAQNDATVGINGLILATVEYIQSGGSPDPIVRAWGSTGQASLQEHNYIGSVGLMEAGDELRGRTRSDNDATGTNVEVGTNHVTTELDA